MLIKLGTQNIFRFRNIYDKEWVIAKNKSFAIQFWFYPSQLLTVEWHWRKKGKQDHHGFAIEVGLLGLVFHAEIYDHRHSEGLYV